MFNNYFIIVTCEHLFNDTNSDSVITMDYSATEGTTVTFSCPPQYVLIGPNTTTCMGNGEWKPDPREVECKGKFMAVYMYSQYCEIDCIGRDAL